ncbi:MAG TPA: carboxypeptidase-like regulatory domain-containing protein [Ferruginibacter sp.]|nr:carboxypeptidase-like regulatory domain-containing protein [Ferruginibacter sp.]
MECKQKTVPILFFVSVVSALFFTSTAFSQVNIKGRVVYEKDNTPAAYASVELLHQKDGELTDQAGFFSLQLSKPSKNDTLQISMVGYETLKIPVAEALHKKEFVLSQKTGNLENVTIKAFSKHDVQGSGSESVGYFRSWNAEHTGGEIGRIFRLPYKEFKIDKVRFKVSNMCDTCLIRVHMRKVVDGIPGEEIFNDSISTSIHKLTLDDKVSEFDISAYDFTFRQREIYVSLEVLRCGSISNPSCYFSFAGTEKGEYIFKSKATTDWQIVDDYTIYLKLFLRY